MKRKIINGVLIVVLVFASYQFISIYLENKHNLKVLDEVQSVYQEANQPSELGNTSAFAELHKINPDITAWLTIAGTAINYPVLQAADNDTYLKTNYQGEQARAGSIFKDYRNTEVTPKHTILYGHNMKDGSMFADLQKYTDAAFFKQHPTFDYDTPEASYRVEVFTVYETTTDFYYIDTDFTKPAAFAQYLQDVKKRSLYETNVKVTDEDHIITLSTCDTGFDYEKGRYVVQGKLQKKE
ncbi:class B sortase [Brochothrix campestris]|uniref:class B sortase n=1 Tax=Brochothrix campestris TaxID=2757 RepID=UPI0038D19291